MASHHATCAGSQDPQGLSAVHAITSNIKPLDLTRYKTLVFDCDGVVLDSNELKTQAYYTVATVFGASHEQAQALMDYHVRLGGVSRYPKFKYFQEEIRVLAPPVRVEEFLRAVDTLRADADRLQKRLERLEQGRR